MPETPDSANPPAAPGRIPSAPSALEGLVQVPHLPETSTKTIMTTRYMPPATREKLEHPAPIGHRHHQILQIAFSLRASGWPPEEIFDVLRPNYEAHGVDCVPDEEIWGVIQGAMRCTLEPTQRRGARLNRRMPATRPRTVEEQACIQHRVLEFVGEDAFTENKFRERARPRRLGPFDSVHAAIFIKRLFHAVEQVNIVFAYWERTKGKAVPRGFGWTRTAEDWCDLIRRRGLPHSDAGAWIRLNPLDGGGIADANVTAFRYALLESDCLPIDLQLGLFAKLSLPLAAVVSSGGKSLHAWVKVDAGGIIDYREAVKRLFDTLAPFGIDPANKNPSRLARLPGVVRMIGAVGGGLQKLIFLSPAPEPGQVIANLVPMEAAHAS